MQMFSIPFGLFMHHSKIEQRVWIDLFDCFRAPNACSQLVQRSLYIRYMLQWNVQTVEISIQIQQINCNRTRDNISSCIQLYSWLQGSIGRNWRQRFNEYSWNTSACCECYQLREEIGSVFYNQYFRFTAIDISFNSRRSIIITCILCVEWDVLLRFTSWFYFNWLLIENPNIECLFRNRVKWPK